MWEGRAGALVRLPGCLAVAMLSLGVSGCVEFVNGETAKVTKIEGWLDDCHEALLLVPTPRENLRGHLPAGFEPLPFDAPFGGPGMSDDGILLVAVVQCAEVWIGDVQIAVEKPDHAAARDGLHAYQLMDVYGTDVNDPAVWDKGQMGWPTLFGRFEMVPTTGGGRASLSTFGMAAAFSWLAGPEQTSGGAFQNWHVVEDTGRWIVRNATLDATAFSVGAATQCALGGYLAEVADATVCSGALVMSNAEAYRYSWTIEVLPGP